ncbi:uncharacterized protein LOC143375900 [Andrena cerasifolii]|uniref:uncharacterized protein LOC143375900 n=1 Tax=Andrena cerasifolii TaxID=2819439 RepID=UPI0040379E4F
MTSIKNLLQSSPEQLQDFLNSFDVVLSDCDGVLWHLDKPIPGAMEALKRLKDLGKKVYLVTNNSTMSTDRYSQKIRKLGLEIHPEQIITTAKVITWYLKKINFRDEAFVISTPVFRQVLLDGGIKLAEENPLIDESNPMATVKSIQNSRSIKAVIVDFSLYCDWVKLAFAISCLERDDVLYLSGAQDEWVICSSDTKLLGPGPLIDIITRQSGRTPIECAKPSRILREFTLETCSIQDPKRCLFIGDTIDHDMKFGTLCGFQKLLVQTGLSKIEDADQLKEARPDFYISSLGTMCSLIDSMHIDSSKMKSS